MQTIARMLFVGLLAGTGFALLGRACPPPTTARIPSVPPAGRVVYLGSGLSDECLISLGAAAAARPGAVLLLDSPPLTPYLRHFLAAYRPDRVIPVGAFSDDKAALERRLGVSVDAPIPWTVGPPIELWRIVFPTAPCVVVSPARPRARLLRAAALAGAKGAPLWISSNQPGETAILARWLGKWNTREVILTGPVDRLALGQSGPPLRGESSGWSVVQLTSTESVNAAYHRCLTATGPIETAVAANPADVGKELGGMSVLAPWLAVTKHAALLLTNSSGTDITSAVVRATRRRPLRQIDTLILAANLKALPMLERLNPIPGDKDASIELEPLTPDVRSPEPFSFAVGRLFHENRAVVPLMLARQTVMTEAGGPHRALVVSNPGGSLPLLEAFSRNTAQELSNSGYDVTAVYGKDVTGPALRKQMVGKDLFLWEGHHNTLINDWGFASWDEPLPPTFVFLQSCLALRDYKVQPLLGRGCIGVVGSSTRTYSGSGGAFSLAFFNALAYEGQTLGGSLRRPRISCWPTPCSRRSGWGWRRPTPGPTSAQPGRSPCGAIRPSVCPGRPSRVRRCRRSSTA